MPQSIRDHLYTPWRLVGYSYCEECVGVDVYVKVLDDVISEHPAKMSIWHEGWEKIYPSNEAKSA